MKILLTAINAKYIHTNLAIRCLKAYAKDYRKQIKLVEFTINNYLDDILQSIYKEKPDFLGFSCYIWNISMVEQLCIELRKLLPNTKIWLGGPEVSYDSKNRLQHSLEIDGIMIGEGEETFKEILDYYIGGTTSLNEVNGIAFRNSALRKEDYYSTHDLVTVTPIRQVLDLSTLPFPYENLDQLDNKIIYYETSRGCPYSCSYCLSSIDKKVRLRNIEQVKEELGIFLSHKVPQVKFVDRTFNCNRAHTLAIWNYIKEHDNGITNFHFEISADILDEEEFSLLNSMREGLVQLEIGVQSTKLETIDAIQRRMNLDKLGHAVNRIHKGRNIHQHLDLIAGLPYENYESFQKSFNDVYALEPDQFQLGFLKVLKGSSMYEESEKWGIVYKSTAPYEVLYTKWINYDEILELKSVEEMVEIYYNSRQFIYAIMYMEHFFRTPFELYLELGRFYEKNGLQGISHSRLRRYEILIDFMKDQKNKVLQKGDYYFDNSYQDNFVGIDILAFKNILVYDLYLRENLKSRPYFAEEQEAYKKLYQNFYKNEEKVREYLMLEPEIVKDAQLKQYVHLEHFTIDIRQTAKTGVTKAVDEFIFFDYMHRDPLDFKARTMVIEL